jgi:hypothetical protein
MTILVKELFQVNNLSTEKKREIKKKKKDTLYSNRKEKK